MLIDMKFICDMTEIRPRYSQTSHLITNTNYSKMMENKTGVKKDGWNHHLEDKTEGQRKEIASPSHGRKLSHSHPF
jgi:hypothetical protein